MARVRDGADGGDNDNDVGDGGDDDNKDDGGGDNDNSLSSLSVFWT